MPLHQHVNRLQRTGTTLEQKERQNNTAVDKYLSPTQVKQQWRDVAQICRNHTLFKHESAAECHADEIR